MAVTAGPEVNLTGHPADVRCGCLEGRRRRRAAGRPLRTGTAGCSCRGLCIGGRRRASVLAGVTVGGRGDGGFVRRALTVTARCVVAGDGFRGDFCLRSGGCPRGGAVLLVRPGGATLPRLDSERRAPG